MQFSPVSEVNNTTSLLFMQTLPCTGTKINFIHENQPFNRVCRNLYNLPPQERANCLGLSLLSAAARKVSNAESTKTEGGDFELKMIAYQTITQTQMLNIILLRRMFSQDCLTWWETKLACFSGILEICCHLCNHEMTLADWTAAPAV